MGKGIIYEVLQKLNEIPTLEAQVLEEKVRHNKGVIDARIKITTKHYQKEWLVEVRRKIVPANIPQITTQIEDLREIILFTDYLTLKTKKLLVNKNIAYADTAGNIFINDDPIYIHIETNKTNRTKLPGANRAFNKTGVKVLFLLLANPEYINKPFRFIGNQVHVAIDTVGKVFRDLRKEKYLIKVDDKKYKWNKREDLIMKWVDAYNRNLRPQLNQRRYRPVNPAQNWKQLDLLDNTYWGGANAADELTDYLQADRWTLYTDQDFVKVMQHMKWIPDPNGKIKVIEKFWIGEDDGPYVPLFITYADLLAHDDPRYLEVANQVYEQIRKHII